MCVCPHLSRPSAVNRFRPSLGGDSGEGVELEVWLLPQLFTAHMARMSEHTGEFFIHLDRAQSPWWLCQISLISLPCVSLHLFSSELLNKPWGCPLRTLWPSLN